MSPHEVVAQVEIGSVSPEFQSDPTSLELLLIAAQRRPEETQSLRFCDPLNEQICLFEKILGASLPAHVKSLYRSLRANPELTLTDQELLIAICAFCEEEVLVDQIRASYVSHESQ
jgi:hypothetical protein